MQLRLLSVALVFISTNAFAQHAHQSNAPVETGQAQFAAIAEIVTQLREDPETDWTQVDIQALRDHLVDMDNVTTKASVEQNIDGMNVTYSVTGDDAVAASVRRMVMAHSPMLQQASGWSVAATEQGNEVNMSVTVSSEEDLNQVKGLGFFGLMTIGAHHQQHHLMIATGNSPH